MDNIKKSALLNALGTSIYIILIASLFYLLDKIPETSSILIPIAMLMLFVFSAALTGSLVFGKPIMWYLNGKKKEALSLLTYTLGILFVITIIVFLLLIFLI